MSTLQSQPLSDNDAQDNPCSGISLLIEPREKDLGGFSVRRLLPFRKRRQVGPWVFFDHMGPAEFAPGEGIDVRPHPHINLATVTYLFEGEIFHRDSLGNAQPIRPGDINLMVAGKGIVHSERTAPDVRASGQRLHGLQLWHALPEAEEETDPAFYHYPSDTLPQTELDGVKLRVMMGEAYGLSAPVKTFCQTVYVEAFMPAGSTLALPDNVPERAVYVAAGGVKMRGTALPTYSMAVLEAQDGMVIEATEASRIALIGGEPLGERLMWWNFVSSRKDRLEKAKSDWKNGVFPKVPGDEEEFIPLPE